VESLSVTCIRLIARPIVIFLLNHFLASLYSYDKSFVCGNKYKMIEGSLPSTNNLVQIQFVSDSY